MVSCLCCNFFLEKKQLEFYPSVLQFPTVFYQDASQLLCCHIQWNNGEPAKGLVFNIPESAKEFLHVEPSHEPGGYEVHLNPQRVTTAGIISEKIRIVHPETELTDSMWVSAQIIASTGRAMISQRASETFDRKLSLLVKNTGNAPLKLFDIQTENGRFRPEPKWVIEPVISPGDSLNFSLVPTIKGRSFTEKTIKDQIMIKVSDFEIPIHRIDVSIATPPRMKRFAKPGRH